MIGEVTRRMLPHLPWVLHLHVDRRLVFTENWRRVLVAPRRYYVELIVVNNFLQFYPVDGAPSGIYTGKMILILPNGFSSLLNISRPRSRFCLVTQRLSPFSWCLFIKYTHKSFLSSLLAGALFSFVLEELTRRITRNRHFVSNLCLLAFAR